MRRSLMVVAALVFAGALLATAGQGILEAQAATGIWSGVYTEEQAARGRGYFLEHCASCHGANLQGGEAKPLAQARFWSDWQETTVDYLLEQISKNMPFSEDGSLAGTLGESLYADIVAHILKTNGFPAGRAPLSRESSAGVLIVPKDGASELPAEALAHVVGCLQRNGSDWQLVRASRPARVIASRKPATDVPLGDRTVTLKFVLTPLQKFVGFRMSATGRLMGVGGAEGLNVTSVAPVSERCE